MSAETQLDVLAKPRTRYAHAGSQHKSKLMDQAVALFGLHRKSASRALRRAPRSSSPTVPLGRPRQYRSDLLPPILKPVWLGCQQPFSKRLLAVLPDWLPFYEGAYRPLSRDRGRARCCATRFPLPPRPGTSLCRATWNWTLWR